MSLTYTKCMFDSVRPTCVALLLLSTLVSCSAAPVPHVKATVCRWSMIGHPRNIAKTCCNRYGLGCDALKIQNAPGVMHINVGDAPNPYLRMTPLRLGNACGLPSIRAPCQRNHECREGVCRRKDYRAAVHPDVNGLDMTARQYERMLAPRSRPRTGQAVPLSRSTGAADPSTAKGEKVQVQESDFQVSGLSVPIEARVPIGSAYSGHTSLLPNVKQRMRKHVRPVAGNNAPAEAAVEAEAEKAADADADPGNETQPSNKTCAETAAILDGMSVATDAEESGKGADSGILDEDLTTSSNAEESEDEQITESVADVVEKMTNVKVDSEMLTALDAAITQTMDKYEEKAEENGELLIDVADLMKGKSDSVEITLPATETVKDADNALLDPSRESTGSAVGDQVRQAVREKLREEMAPDMLDKVADLLINSVRCMGTGATKMNADEKRDCDVAKWIRANWFKEQV